MTFTFHPGFARIRTPGQVSRLDAEIDRSMSMPPKYTITMEGDDGGDARMQRPILRAQMVAADLGLPQHAENSVTSLVKTLSFSSSNEVDFRQGVLGHLIDERYDAPLRRAIMNRALSFFRSARPSGSTSTPTLTHRRSELPNSRQDGTYRMTSKTAPKVDDTTAKAEARGGKYHRRVPDGNGKWKYVYSESEYANRPDAHVDGASAGAHYVQKRVRRVLDKAGDAGCSVRDFHKLVYKHGAKSVAAALKACGAGHVNGRIRIAGAVSKADAEGAAEALPSSTSTGPKGAGGPASPKKLPPGTRRIWHNRIVERGVDDKWHVVGHVAGLEQPGKVPLLDPSEIDEAHKKELIAKLKELIAHEKNKDAAIHAPIKSAKPEAVPAAGSPAAGAPTAKPAAAPQPKPKAASAKPATKPEPKAQKDA